MEARDYQDVFQGTWEEISVSRARELKGHVVEVRIIDIPRPRNPQMIREGMFPQLLAVTEEDFKSAEWHGNQDFV